MIDSFYKASSWSEFIHTMRGPPDIADNIHHVLHPARHLLHRIKRSGVPVLQKTSPWSLDQKDSAIHRGSHPSTAAHTDFLREEMADMVQQRFWIVLPYHLIKHIPALKLSPMGVVPQRDRRPRVIVDFTFSGVNQQTVTVAPYDSMQFGRAFDRLIHKIHHANRRFGPVFMIKVDLSDGFYRVPLSTSHLPHLGVAFPHLPHEPPLVALPLVLPMGWVASPPYFCALTETAADLANQLLHQPSRYPLHPLSSVADNPTDPVVIPRLSVSSDRAAPSVPTLPLPLTLSLPSQRRAKLHYQPPFQQHIPTRPVAYVDVYMDDFLGLSQGHPQLHNQVRSKLLHSIDSVFRPLEPHDAHTSRKHPVSLKKLNKGDAQWETRKILLGWVVDTIAETIELPPHRADKLLAILHTLTHRRRVTLKHWQQYLGELRSMVLAIPGGRGLFSTLYTGLTSHDASNRIRIRRPLHDALLDFQLLAQDLAARPTRLGEIVDTLPAATGTADASGLGMGGVWLSPDPTFTPTVWRASFPPKIQSQLVSWENPTGTITNSDLELAAQITAQDVLVTAHDCRERTISTFTDNIATRAWHRKGSRTTLGATAYLLRLLALHQRSYRYRATIDYLPGPLNVMADDASRLWNLSNTALLHHFNLHYPQTRSWQLSSPRPEMLSAVTTALQCKRSAAALYPVALNHATQPGFDGHAIATHWASIHRSPTSQITFQSSKSLPTVTGRATFQPPITLSALAPWKAPSAPLARRWPAWGPRIRV